MSLRPGSLMPMWGDRARYGVVLASSRHKRTYDKASAFTDLEAMFAAENRRLESTEVWTLFSHTKAARENGCYGDCEAAEWSWCAEGDGKAWRRVLVGIEAPEEAA